MSRVISSCLVKHPVNMDHHLLELWIILSVDVLQWLNEEVRLRNSLHATSVGTVMSEMKRAKLLQCSKSVRYGQSITIDFVTVYLLQPVVQTLARHNDRAVGQIYATPKPLCIVSYSTFFVHRIAQGHKKAYSNVTVLCMLFCLTQLDGHRFGSWQWSWFYYGIQLFFSIRLHKVLIN
jgi:hypothetical protein